MEFCVSVPPSFLNVAACLFSRKCTLHTFLGWKINCFPFPIWTCLPLPKMPFPFHYYAKNSSLSLKAHSKVSSLCPGLVSTCHHVHSPLLSPNLCPMTTSPCSLVLQFLVEPVDGTSRWPEAGDLLPNPYPELLSSAPVEPPIFQAPALAQWGPMTPLLAFPLQAKWYQHSLLLALFATVTNWLNSAHTPIIIFLNFQWNPLSMPSAFHWILNDTSVTWGFAFLLAPAQNLEAGPFRCHSAGMPHTAVIHLHLVFLMFPKHITIPWGLTDWTVVYTLLAYSAELYKCLPVKITTKLQNDIFNNMYWKVTSFFKQGVWN